MSDNQRIYDGSFWLLFLSILMMTILLAGTVLSSKMIALGESLRQPGSTIVYPLAFLLSGVVAEIYGYNTSKKLIWFVIICGFVFALLIEFVLMLPSPEEWQKATSYQDIFGNILRFSTAGTLGIIVGLFTNSYIISKTKVLIEGRHFWLRSLSAVAIGEATHILVTGSLLFYGIFSFSEIARIMLTMYLFRMGAVLILIFPTQQFVTAIKKAEKVSYHDYEIKFNPLRVK
jgi:queuosine precursor transporter